MLSLKLLIRDVIDSYLGPNKSYKVLVNEKDSNFCQCPLQLLQEIDKKDPLTCLIQEALCVHHEQFGCSTLSLLTMWYLWDAEFQQLIEEGCELSDITKYAQKCVEYSISMVPKISSTIEEMFNLPNKKEQTVPENVKLNNMSKYPKCHSLKIANFSKEKIGCIPVGIRYSSRHFSPACRKSELNTDKDTADKNDTIFDCLNGEDPVRQDTLNQFFSTVEKICHSNNESPELIQSIWIDQVLATKELKFNIDGIIICPITAPCVYSTVIQGLLIKSNTNCLYDQELKKIEPCRTLMIKGSITFGYVHLGFSPQTSIIKQKTPEGADMTEKDNWIKKCCSLISQLGINNLIVKGDVDPAIASYCAAHSVHLLDGISWDTLKILHKAASAPVCTYLLDCDEENVISNVTLKRWSISDKVPDIEFYKVNVCPENKKMKLFTVFLCHPSGPVLNCLSHQFWHLSSRLKLATEGRLLPGGGKTEEWCSDMLQTYQVQNCVEAKILKSVANGFSNFSAIVSKKMNLNPPSRTDIFDEFQSKTHAWLSAMTLLLMTLQCDILLVNGCEDTNVNNLK